MAVKKTISGMLVGERIIADDSPQAVLGVEKSRLGEHQKGKVVYSFLEAVYLVEQGKLSVLSGKTVVDATALIKKAQKIDKEFLTRFIVFKDLRDRGYIVKTALKFGADFRVYDKGIKPGEGHAKWVVFPVHESKTLTWQDFSAKNRVSHSTRKLLLIGVVDDEGAVTYYEVAWKRP